MGVSESKDQAGSSQHVGAEVQTHIERLAVYRDTEPRISLGNQSAYSVSYWVFEDSNRKRTKASRKRLVRSMGLQLNGGNPAERTATGGTNKEKEDIVDQDDGSVYFLTRDHRMGPMGGTQATKVPFPVGCQEMRVCAFFEVDGQWQLFHNKVYSIGLFRKIFNFTALDVHMAPRIDRSANR